MKIKNPLKYLLAGLMVLGHGVHAQVPAEVPLDSRLNEEIIFIAGTDMLKSKLQTTIFKPNGKGPFPLVVFNHGHEAGSKSYGSFQGRDRCPPFTAEMLKRGYAVAYPMRKGYAGSGGGRPRDFQEQYEDVHAVADYLAKQPYVDAGKIILAGQSLGGYVGLMAAAEDERNRYLGMINFAGGVPTGYNPTFERQLEKMSSPKTVPSLWFYGNNDFLTSPAHLDKLEQAYKKGGAKFEIIRSGVFSGGDAHGMVYFYSATNIWTPKLESFLTSLGLPAQPVVKLSSNVIGQFKFISDADRALAEGRIQRDDVLRTGMSKFRGVEVTPKALAVSEDGRRWSYSSGHEIAPELAIKSCEKSSNGSKCRIFAINDQLVAQ